MGKVLSYRDYLERLEKELNNFKSEMAQDAEENGVEIEDILETLDAYEAEFYEWLQKRTGQLKRWVETENKYGAYRRAEGGN